VQSGRQLLDCIDLITAGRVCRHQLKVHNPRFYRCAARLYNAGITRSFAGG
jgi:hypothetical protein